MLAQSFQSLPQYSSKYLLLTTLFHNVNPFIVLTQQAEKGSLKGAQKTKTTKSLFGLYRQRQRHLRSQYYHLESLPLFLAGLSFMNQQSWTGLSERLSPQAIKVKRSKKQLPILLICLYDLINNKMECIVCHRNNKYKCSKCRQPYCSIPCYKTHQLTCSGYFQPRISTVQAPVEEDQIIKTDYLSDEELRIPQSQLQRLGKDQKLKNLLKDEGLRGKLRSIDNSKQRMTEVLQSMKSQQFYHFYQQVMQVLFDGNQLQ